MCGVAARGETRRVPSHQRPITCTGAFAVVATDLDENETLVAYRRRVESARRTEADERRARRLRARAAARSRARRHRALLLPGHPAAA